MPIHRTVLPADGATGFPTNGRILVLLDRWPPEIRARLAEEFRLLAPDGGQVELRGEVEGTILTLTPTRELAPLQAYVLESVYAYGDGRLLSDEERWRYAGGLRSGRAQGPGRPTAFSRTWFPTASFRTGEGPDARVPAQPTLLEAIYATAGDSVTVQVTMEDTPDLAVGDLLAFEVKGQGLVWRSPHKAWPAELAPLEEGNPQRIGAVGDSPCSQDVVHIDASEAPEVRTLAISVSGTVSARGPWTPAVRRGGDGRPVGQPARREETTYPWWVEAFFAPPLQEAPALLLEGPPGCPHGLLPTGTSVLPDHRWNQGVDGRGFALVGEQGWLLVEGQEEREASLALLDAQAKPTQAIPLGDRRAVARPVPGDPPVVLATREDPGRIRVWRPGGGTTPGWERLLAEGELGSGPFMVTGGDRVLVGWTRP
ncbi:MAG: Ig-like domain-containing protein, partial [Pseudomonadota bacterium]